jgi:phosphatidylglycerol---prolipoprotein diacylglyceryl transferase
MYPNLYYAVKDLFGIEITGLKLINSFGFFVAIAFITASAVLSAELKRKEKEGLLIHEEEKMIVGAPASVQELLFNFLLGFIFGYKIIGAFVVPAALNDPQSFILSTNGSAPVGVLVGLFFLVLKWYEKNKVKLPKPEEKTFRIWPHDRVGDIVLYAAIFGFLGAKIFHNLENWGEFVKDPIGNLIAFSGLTFYGGLICATVAIIYFAGKHKIGVVHLADAMAPTMMFAYAMGRIGCQVSGDGDWGIVNNNPKPFAWMPDGLWSSVYAHNVIGEGVPIKDCVGQYCNQLPMPVYPTALYEVIACLLLFGVLWFLRTRIKVAGRLAALYLMFNGIERFLVEKIRVNTKYVDLPFQPTQAEIISLCLFLGGVFLWWKAGKWNLKQQSKL